MHKIHRVLKAALLLGGLAVVVLALSSCRGGNTPKPLSSRVVAAEMARHPDGSYLDGQEGNLKWNYTTGLELLSFLDVYKAYGDKDVLAYVDGWYDRMVADDGTITKYSVEKYSTDHICPARTLFSLYDITGKEKYRKAMDLVWTQVQGQPRTPEGGFWHKAEYPEQMWLDGLYMAQPFYAMYVTRYIPESDQAAYYEDIMKQFRTVAEHTYDPATRLYRHAWDSSHKMFWCDPDTGQSDHAWGRALGWYVMAIVDVLPFIPEGTPGRSEVVGILRGIFDVLPGYADPATGMWYQVLDRPGAEGNYLEATCCAMFSYALLKGTSLGYLDSSLRPYAKDTYSRLLSTFVVEDAEGRPELSRCCAVAGLGGKQMRRGDYQYYISEPVISNDPKGIGPLVWASLEAERMEMYGR